MFGDPENHVDLIAIVVASVIQYEFGAGAAW
jgi:hypothetical protein